jgi:Ras-related protein Rab-18
MASQVNSNISPVHVKVCGIGDRGCGTSSVIRRLAAKAFSERYWPTVGADFTIMDMDIGGSPLTFYFWDINASSEFQRLRPFYMSNVCSFFITFDLTRHETMRHVPQWHREIITANPGAHGIIIGTKIDRCNDDVDIGRESIERLEQETGCKVVLASCKTGEGCQSALLELVRLHMPFVQSLENSFLHARGDPVQTLPLWP